MIKYMIDKESKYMDDILNHLRNYNRNFTGEKKSISRCFYLVEDDCLKVGVNTTLAWDWVMIEDIVYDNSTNLQEVIATICETFKGDAVGIRYSSRFVEAVETFKDIGFKEISCTKYSPLMSNYYIMEYRDLDSKLIVNNKVLVQEDKNEQYNEIIIENTKQLKLKYNVKDKNEDLIIVALDNDDFVGGVHGIVYDDHMYINLLTVVEGYRGQDIGSVLMKMIEESVIDKNIVTISVGTCEFQAKPFYEKIGYKTIITQSDFPKGFFCYTLVKSL